MNHARRRAAVGWIALLSIPILSWAQVADDSREKTEKVSDILSALQAEPGKRIADIGAGEGFYSLRIARAVGPTGRVTAVDVSEKYLEKLRARIQQDKVTNVDVVVGAVDDPRLPQGTFDAVLIYNAYHEMTTPEPILKAIFMALKPAGDWSCQSRCTTTCGRRHAPSRSRSTKSVRTSFNRSFRRLDSK